MPGPGRDVTTGPSKALPGSQQVMPVVTMMVRVVVVMVPLAGRWSTGGAKAATGPDKRYWGLV